MSNLRDQLTYPDLAGRRKLRLYVLAALTIALIVAGIFLFAQARQANVQALVEATPRSVAQTTPAIVPTHTPSPSPTPEGCPEDPNQWSFKDVFPGDHYRRIEPSCVFDGLGKTVAWHMLERLGYSKPEAAKLLSFTTGNNVSSLPWQPTLSITGLTNTQGPMTLALQVEWAPHPDYHYWTVDTDGAPGLVYSLRGCYRTRDIIGNDAEAWDTRPVHCLVAVDYTPGWVVNELGEHVYAADWSDQPPTRTFVLFGYTDAGRWVLLGELQDQHLSLENADDLPGEQALAATRYGAQVWDAHWLEETFGLDMRSLPEGWQTFTDPAAIQAIGEALNTFDGQPPE